MVEAQAVADALMTATLNTVALKLPEFSPDRIEYWVIAVEAEINLHVPAITQDLTRYSYVVAAHKGQVMNRVTVSDLLVLSLIALLTEML